MTLIMYMRQSGNLNIINILLGYSDNKWNPAKTYIRKLPKFSATLSFFKDAVSNRIIVSPADQ